MYNTNTRNCIINQCGLNQKVVNFIKRELTTVNLFVQGLYQLCDMDYPQVQLIIQQLMNNDEIAACIIIYSTAITQECCMQIWRVGKEKPDYINILNENYKALQYLLFFLHGEIGWHIYWIDLEYQNIWKILQVDYYWYHIMTRT